MQPNTAGVEQSDPIETIQVNYYGFRDTCHILFPILRPHARVVNMTSRRGHLSMFSKKHLRDMLASPDLTEEEVNDFIMLYIKYVWPLDQ